MDIARRLFRETGTTAGYDPDFMSGTAKSVFFPQSSNLYDTAALVVGGVDSAVLFKFIVLVSDASLPLLVALAGLLLRLRPGPIAAGVLLYLLYLWSDFPINYAMWGMTTYLFAVPLGMVTVAVFVRYLESGGWKWWLAGVLTCWLVFLAHITIALVVCPAALAVYLGRQVARGENPPPARPAASRVLVAGGHDAAPQLLLARPGALAGEHVRR